MIGTLLVKEKRTYKCTDTTSTLITRLNNEFLDKRLVCNLPKEDCNTILDCRFNFLSLQQTFSNMLREHIKE